MYQFAQLIDGRWRDDSPASFSTFNPAHPERRVGTYGRAEARHGEEALHAARRAQKSWAQVPPLQRIAQVSHWLDRVHGRSDEVTMATVLEQGKPLSEARGEFDKGVSEGRCMLGMAHHGNGEVLPAARRGFRNLVLRRPRGIIAAVCPWNFPIMTPLRKLVPALLFGNAVVLKPSEFTPAAACVLADCSIGVLPDGLVQILNGEGQVGAWLVARPEVAGVTFTGSVATGRRIYSATANSLAELSLELGGKNPAIVHDPVDVDTALDAIAGAAFAVCGQRCTAISRVLVREDLAAQVREGLARRVRALTLGDGLVPGVTTGPLIHADHREKVHAAVEKACFEGAEAVTGGRFASPGSAPEGYFYEPTILAGVNPEMEIAQQEVFGPVLTVQEYADFDDAMRIANGVEYGLTASLFTQSHHLVQRFLEESETGMLHVNHGTVPDSHMPFGGIKHSGVGPYSSVGLSSINFYTTEHSAYLA